jgi:hypothetical protein
MEYPEIITLTLNNNNNALFVRREKALSLFLSLSMSPEAMDG